MKTRIPLSSARPALLALVAAAAPLVGCATGATDHAAHTTGPYPLRVVRTTAPAAKPASESTPPAAPQTRRAPGAYPLRA